MDIKIISANIKKYRELKGLTREVVASELEMSVSGYSKIERGEIDLTITKLQKISEVLEVSASDILNFDVTNIFNISNNQQVQGLGSKESNITNNLNKVDDYTEKYIKMLEEKIQQLESKQLITFASKNKHTTNELKEKLVVVAVQYFASNKAKNNCKLVA